MVKLSIKYLADKIIISSNGISVDLIKSVEKTVDITRDYNRMIWPSSPDRGLNYLIPILKSARFFNSSLYLDLYYGFDNIDKVCAQNARIKAITDETKSIIKAAEKHGVTWYGRINQIQLIKEWLRTNIWCYPTNFVETSCINSMESQALGAIPIASPKWALRENIMHGVLIEGDAYEDKLVHASFASEIFRVSRDRERWDSIRPQMMTDARVRFNWERFVDQWESWVYGINCPFYSTQYAFQYKYSLGRILNVGCDSDAAGLKTTKGAINMDVCTHNVLTNVVNPVDIECDIRCIPARILTDDNVRRYDTIILGDILEHFKIDNDIIVALENCKLFLNENGRVIITCPEDPRTVEEQKQHAGVKDLGNNDIVYINGVSIYHRLITHKQLLNMLTAAGYEVELTEPIDYTHHMGWGIIAYVSR
jgi:hypothetical protein